MPTRVVIGGPRGRGKSTLTASIYTQLRDMGVDAGVHEIDVYSDTIRCILGEKPWRRRKKKKHAWFDPTIQRRIAEFANDQHDIVLGDLPGKITNPFLPKMVEPADSAVILFDTWENLLAWERFFSRRRISVVLRVVSYQGQLPLLPQGLTNLMYVGGLNREVVLNHETQSVAQWLAAYIRRQALRTG